MFTRGIEWCFLLWFIIGLISCKSVNNDGHSLQINQYHLSGDSCYKIQQYKKAVNAYQQAAVAYETKQQWHKSLICRNQIVQCYIQNASFAKATSVAHENLKLCEKKLLNLNFLRIKTTTQRLIARIFNKTYQYDRAEAALKQVLHTYHTSLDSSYAETAQVYNDLGVLFLKKSSYSVALEYHQKALDILQKHLSETNQEKFLPAIAQTYNYTGMSYGERGEFDTAINYYRKTLRLREKIYQNKEHPGLAASYNNIGINYYLKAQQTARQPDIVQLDSARLYLIKAIDIREKALGKGFYSVAGFYNNLAHVYLGQKKYALSFRHFNIALDIRKKTQGASHPLVAQSYIFIGNVYAAKNDLATAISYYKKSLRINCRKPIIDYACLKLQDFAHPGFLFEVLRELSIALKQQALKSNRVTTLNGTLAFIRNNVNLLGTYIKTIENKKDKISFNSQLTRFCTQAIDVLNRLTELAPQARKSYEKEAFYFLERGKASVLSVSLAEVDARKFAGIPANLLAKEKELRNSIFFYDSQLLKKPENKKLYARLFDKKRLYERLIRQLEQDYPEYYALKHQRKVVKIVDVQQKLTAQAALLQYIIGKHRSYVFLITKESFRLISISSAKDLLPVVKRFYSTLQGAYAMQKFAGISHQAYQMLVAPLLPYLKGKTRLTIIPDWQLAKLPFDALIDWLPTKKKLDNDYAGLNYLVKKYQINYHYSASIWSKKRLPNSKNELDFVAFAPFSEGVGKVLTTRFMNSALPASKIEVNTVLNMFRQKKQLAKAYLSDKATKAIFLQKSIRAGIVHIASHSVYDRNNEKLARIYFSKEKNGHNNGSNYLLVGGIYNLSLHADLVVLSSCESGLGKSYKGEGMMSLTRSFLYAGARNIVFSLWKVNDQYTKNLMIKFYKAILYQELSFSEALQCAKQQIIAENKTLHPKHWSGFSIIGD